MLEEQLLVYKVYKQDSHDKWKNVFFGVFSQLSIPIGNGIDIFIQTVVFIRYATYDALR